MDMGALISSVEYSEEAVNEAYRIANESSRLLHGLTTIQKSEKKIFLGLARDIGYLEQRTKVRIAYVLLPFLSEIEEEQRRHQENDTHQIEKNKGREAIITLIQQQSLREQKLYRHFMKNPTEGDNYFVAVQLLKKARQRLVEYASARENETRRQELLQFLPEEPTKIIRKGMHTILR